MEILKETTVPTITFNSLNFSYFQQNNSLVHNTKVDTKFYKDSELQLIKWSALSYDIIIVDEAWKIISNAIYIYMIVCLIRVRLN